MPRRHHCYLLIILAGFCRFPAPTYAKKPEKEKPPKWWKENPSDQICSICSSVGNAIGFIPTGGSDALEFAQRVSGFCDTYCFLNAAKDAIEDAILQATCNNLKKTCQEVEKLYGGCDPDLEDFCRLSALKCSVLSKSSYTFKTFGCPCGKDDKRCAGGFCAKADCCPEDRCEVGGTECCDDGLTVQYRCCEKVKECQLTSRNCCPDELCGVVFDNIRGTCCEKESEGYKCVKTKSGVWTCDIPCEDEGEFCPTGSNKCCMVNGERICCAEGYTCCKDGCFLTELLDSCGCPEKKCEGDGGCCVDSINYACDKTMKQCRLKCKKGGLFCEKDGKDCDFTLQLCKKTCKAGGIYCAGEQYACDVETKQCKLKCENEGTFCTAPLECDPSDRQCKLPCSAGGIYCPSDKGDCCETPIRECCPFGSTCNADGDKCKSWSQACLDGVRDDCGIFCHPYCTGCLTNPDFTCGDCSQCFELFATFDDKDSLCFYGSDGIEPPARRYRAVSVQPGFFDCEYDICCEMALCTEKST